MYFGAVVFALDLMPSFWVLICFREYFEILGFVAATEFEAESLVLKAIFLFGVWLQKGVSLNFFEINFVTIYMRFKNTINTVF